MWQTISAIIGFLGLFSTKLLAHAPASGVAPEQEVMHLWTELHHGAPLLWLGLGLAALAFLSLTPLTKK